MGHSPLQHCHHFSVFHQAEYHGHDKIAPMPKRDSCTKNEPEIPFVHLLVQNAVK